MSPEAVNHEVERRYGLPYDSVWRHSYNQFSHGRVSDPNVYFSQDWSIAAEYAKLGSEVISDALFAAWHLLSDPFDEEGDYKPGKPAEREQWMASETAKHYQPVVVTVEIPFDRVMKDEGVTTPTDYERWMSYGPQTTIRIQAPIPASWIVKVETI